MRQSGSGKINEEALVVFFGFCVAAVPLVSTAKHLPLPIMI